jgi:hypothetical protein
MFKRNQVELAIARLLEPNLGAPSSGLKTRVKRLLDTDRALERNPRSNAPAKAHFAFFRDAAPGTGVDVWFTGYEAFALLLGLQLMQHNWPQRVAVSILRQVRPDLEKEHDRILRIDRKTLFDPKKIKRTQLPGSPAFDTSSPSFLVIVSHHQLPAAQETEPYACSVQPDLSSASQWVLDTTKGKGGGSTMFELTVLAHDMAQALDQTTPESRGRKG